MGVSRIVAAGLAGYLIGTFPTADLAVGVAGGRHDLRTEGSGNPGAMNAASVLGTGWGLAVLAGDMAKGAVAGVAGRRIGGDPGAYAAAAASIAGHVAPVWKRGRGGKGVATSAGASLAVFPVYFPVDLAVAVAGATRYRQAERVTRAACAGWVVAALAAWRFRLPNAWGPEPGPGLPLFAAASSGIVLAAFARGRRQAAEGAS
ncbi:MAG: glycerol-3-phosphate acyltransferase [Actinomycetes bacterium]